MMNMMIFLRFTRKLPGKGFLIPITLLWVIATGFRKISFKICTILTLVIIVIWFIYALIIWIIRKRKGKAVERAGDLVVGFEEKLTDALKSAKDTPWYMVIGPSKCGKTYMLRNSDIEFPRIYCSQQKPIKDGIEETKNCDLFLTKESFIFDTAGRYVTRGNDARVNKEWLALLSLLKKHRKMRQIEGLVVVVDIANLLQTDDDAMELQARAIRSRIEDIVSYLKISFPVYLIFTKCDVIYGFTEFFDDLSGPDRMQVWGATLKCSEEESPETLFRRECEQLSQALNTRRLYKLASAKEQGRRPVYTFPLQFDEAYKKLSRFVSGLFPAVSEKTLIFRGFYFTSVMAMGTQQAEQPPIDFVLQSVAGFFERHPSVRIEQYPKDAGEPRGYFIRDIFTKLIFPDRDLARPAASLDRRRMFMRLAFCGAMVLLAALFISLLAVSYVGNKRLMNEVQVRSGAVSEIRDDTPLADKRERFESLRKPIVQLESFSLMGVPWHQERERVAETARLLYLTDKYGNSSGYKVKLKRKVKIPVMVLKSNPAKLMSDPDKLEPIKKVDVRAVVTGREYNLRTNKEGYTRLKTKVADGKVDVAFSTDHEEAGFEVERNQIYEIQPGERVSKSGVRFIFSKLRRIIEVQCADQSGEKLPGVPVSIIYEESNQQDVKESNEKGISRFELEAPENAVFLIYYGDSNTNYKEEQPDTVKIAAGQAKYLIERKLRRKIQVSITAFTVTSDDTQQPKPGVSISIGGKDQGTTDNAGQCSGTSDIIPSTKDISANPWPNDVEVHKSETGYSVVLKYRASGRVSPPVSQTGSGRAASQYLKVVDGSQRAIRGAEVWVYTQGGGRDPFGSDDEMTFSSSGRQIRLVRLSSTTNSEGRIGIPKQAEGRELLVCHPEYWPQKIVKSGSGSTTCEMVSIKRERSVREFDQSQIDGSDYYYKRAKEEHQKWRRSEAIALYKKAIKLLPRKPNYFGLGWAYYEVGKEQESRNEVRRGLGLTLKDPKYDKLQSEYQKELRKLEEILK